MAGETGPTKEEAGKEENLSRERGTYKRKRAEELKALLARILRNNRSVEEESHRVLEKLRDPHPPRE